MSNAALLLLSIGAAHGAAQTGVPAHDAEHVLQFAPPVDAPLLLTIVDDRRVAANGARAVFSVSHVVRFVPDGDGQWLVSMVEHAIACDGLAAVCDAFRAMMAPRVGLARQFRVSASGVVATLDAGSAPRASGPGALAANVRLVIAERDARSPGSLASAELMEALRFVGRPLAGLAATPDGLLMIADATAADAVGVSLSTVAQVDRATGLVVHSTTETRAGDPSGQGVLLGTRRWTLQPMAEPY